MTVQKQSWVILRGLLNKEKHQVELVRKEKQPLENSDLHHILLFFYFLYILFLFISFSGGVVRQQRSTVGVSNGLVGLKLKILKGIEIEIGLGPDPFKFKLGSNGLGSNNLKKWVGS